MNSEIDQQSLLWGLDRLALWGELEQSESIDPELKREAASNARGSIARVAWKLERNDYK